MAAVERHEYVVVARAGSTKRQHPTRQRQPIAGAGKFVIAPPDRFGSVLSGQAHEQRRDRRVGHLAKHSQRTRLHHTRLLRRYLFLGGTKVLLMVEFNVGDDGHGAVTDIRRVPPSTHSHFDYRRLDAEVVQPPKGTSGKGLEERTAFSCRVFGQRDGGDRVGELIIGYRQ